MYARPILIILGQLGAFWRSRQQKRVQIHFFEHMRFSAKILCRTTCIVKSCKIENQKEFCGFSREKEFCGFFLKRVLRFSSFNNFKLLNFISHLLCSSRANLGSTLQSGLFVAARRSLREERGEQTRFPHFKTLTSRQPAYHHAHVCVILAVVPSKERFEDVKR